MIKLVTTQDLGLVLSPTWSFSISGVSTLWFWTSGSSISTSSNSSSITEAFNCTSVSSSSTRLLHLHLHPPLPEQVHRLPCRHWHHIFLPVKHLYCSSSGVPKTESRTSTKVSMNLSCLSNSIFANYFEDRYAWWFWRDNMLSNKNEVSQFLHADLSFSPTLYLLCP